MEELKHNTSCLLDSQYIVNDEARRLFELAYEEQMNGAINEAIQLYARSVSVSPSAQAYTYMGWAYSLIKEYEKAVELCKRAIDLDPEYGNPYNDIGAYLIQMGTEDESIYWLERAIVAPKYHAKFYPYYNLGRVYHSKNLIRKAITCFESACRIKPDFHPALEYLENLRRALN